MLKWLFELGSVAKVLYVLLTNLGLCFHIYENLGFCKKTYIDEAFEHHLLRCEKCGRLKEKKEVLWRR